MSGRKLQIRDLSGRKRKVEVLFEDEHLIVLNKPAPLLTIPDHWDPGRPNLLTFLQRKLAPERPFVVHRLDAGTSGVIVFAKTPEAHRALCAQFDRQKVERTYEAIVAGEVERDQGVVSRKIAPNPRVPGHVIVSSRGKDAVTEYRVLERFVGFTRVLLRPKTGRPHQLRVHMQALGHPVATDPDYGGRAALYLSEFKPTFSLAEGEVERPFIARPSLHALSLAFTHPVSGERLEVTAEFPKDYRTFLRILREYRQVARFLESETM